ncbi:hypothetical protein HV170_01520 [Citrobacter freundii]|uniref:hypothetical protein n=1 Tax=Citrobacter freundii TaxID=546 RepID=UPI0015F4EBCE|nr:hypothetical protein [Citrobacter freundii]
MRKISLIAASCFLMLLPDTVFSEDFLSKENSMLLERLSEDKVISNSGIPNNVVIAEPTTQIRSNDLQGKITALERANRLREAQYRIALEKNKELKRKLEASFAEGINSQDKKTTNKSIAVNVNSELTNQSMVLNKKIAGLEKKLADVTNQKEKLEQQTAKLTVLEKEKYDLSKQLAILSASSKESPKQKNLLEQQTQKLSYLETEKAKLLKQKVSSEQKIAQLALLEKDKIALEKDKADLVKQIVELNKSGSADVLKQKAALGQQTAQLAALEKDKGVLAKQIADLNKFSSAEAAKQKAALEKQSAQLTELEKDKAKATAKSKLLAQQILKLVNVIEDTGKVKKYLESQNVSLIAQNSEQKSNMVKMAESLRNSENLSKLVAEERRKNIELNTLISKLNVSIGEKSSRIGVLEQELSKNAQKNIELEASIRQMNLSTVKAANVPENAAHGGNAVAPKPLLQQQQNSQTIITSLSVKEQSEELMRSIKVKKGAIQQSDGVVYVVESKGAKRKAKQKDNIQFVMKEEVSTGIVLSNNVNINSKVDKLPELLSKAVTLVGTKGRVKIYIPPDLAYGGKGIPNVAPSGIVSILTVDVTGLKP